MNSKECHGQCCLPLPEELAVYVEGITGTLRLCTQCAAMIGPPIEDEHLKEYQQQYAHFKKTGVVIPTPSEVALRKRVNALCRFDFSTRPQ